MLVVMGEVDLDTSAQLERALDDAIRSSAPVIVDLSECSFFDSSAITVLVTAQKRLHDDGLLSLVIPDSHILKIFQMTHLDEVFDIRPARPAASTRIDDRPRLFYFYSRTSGLSRRVDAFLAQVLQRHRNHDTFNLIRVAVEDQPQLTEHFNIGELPTLVVIDGNEEKARLEAPRSRALIEETLSPWLLRTPKTPLAGRDATRPVAD